MHTLQVKTDNPPCDRRFSENPDRIFFTQSGYWDTSPFDSTCGLLKPERWGGKGAQSIMQSMLLRSFIAIEIPSEMQASIVRSITDLQKALPRPLIRWVATQNLHLTLKFLGDVSPANLERLAEALKAETARQTGFMLTVGKIGAFPTARRARVLWVGIEAPAALSTLQQCVESTAARMGHPPEERPFSPHLTIGRVGQTTSTSDLTKIRTALAGTQVGTLSRVHVDALHIFRSDLNPGGSVYISLYTLPLGLK